MVLSDLDIIDRLRNDIYDLYDYLLETSERVLIHCTAGIHRTGMVAYSLLRFSGYTQQESLETILLMRKETKVKQIGLWRIKIAEDQIVNGEERKQYCP